MPGYVSVSSCKKALAGMSCRIPAEVRQVGATVRLHLLVAVACLPPLKLSKKSQARQPKQRNQATQSRLLRGLRTCSTSVCKLCRDFAVTKKLALASNVPTDLASGRLEVPAPCAFLGHWLEPRAACAKRIELYLGP